MRFDRFTVTVLVRPDSAPEMSEEELDALQDRHLAYRAELKDRGLILANGPFVDQDDERYRGFAIWSVDTETARELSNGDPSVIAGRLAFEVMTWMMPAGSLEFHRVTSPRSIAEAASEEE